MKTKQDDETLRYIYLGLTKDGYYSVLTADLDPQQIIERIEKGIKLLPISFTCRGTSRRGCDEPNRTCHLEGIRPVDHIRLTDPLFFHGTYNVGVLGVIEELWTVSIIEIMTVEDQEYGEKAE